MSWKSGTLFQIIFFVSFLISGLCINLIQGLGYLLLPKRTFRTLNYYLQWSMYGQFIFLFDWWSSSRIRMFGPEGQIKEMESYFGHEHALILCNHHYETDWLFGWIIAERFTVLGAAKVFSKAILRYVPVIGWNWSLSDIIFVKRNWSEDQRMLPGAIKRLEDYPYPFWLLIYAEGTRFTPEKHLACQEFKSKANDPSIPDLKHHLIPRLRGFYHTFINLDLKVVPAVYDVTIVTDRKASSLSYVLSGQPLSADVYVRRIPLENIGKDEPSVKKFLMQTYKEKDALVENLHQLGHFGPATQEFDFPKRRIHSLLNTLALNLIVQIPIFYYVLNTLLTGSAIQISSLVAIITLLYFGMKKMIGITKVRDSSEYGNQKNK
uniref:1-acyl-sn-glycerol-3-phosphate acyltransferase gamma n=1 Tax=Caligus clemensi TaxID=344056 RepID=C1C099_CALCM|nr:1-acyl-sn-glycerol-3-phosphate acyltransferase gamma [Caligus clemensi]